MLGERRLNLPACAWPVAHAVRDPGDIDVTQEVEVGEALTRRLLDPHGANPIVMLGVHDGADEIGVEDREPARATQHIFFGAKLTARDRLHVGRIEWRSLVDGVFPRELGNPRRREALRELARQPRLARRFGARDGHATRSLAGHTKALSDADCSRNDARHCRQPRTARTENTRYSAAVGHSSLYRNIATYATSATIHTSQHSTYFRVIMYCATRLAAVSAESASGSDASVLRARKVESPTVPTANAAASRTISRAGTRDTRRTP